MTQPSASYRELVAAIVLYLVCLFGTGLLWQSPLVLTALLIAVAVVVFTMWRRPTDRIFYFAPLVMGPTGEAFAVYLGAWDYSRTEFLPLWLPFLWGIAGLCMGRVMTLLQGRPHRT